MRRNLIFFMSLFYPLSCILCYSCSCLFFVCVCPRWTENNASSHSGSGRVRVMAGGQHTQTGHVFRWADTVIGAVV